MIRNALGMSAGDLAEHAAKLCKQAARHRSIAGELWAEAMACEAEIRRLEAAEAAGVKMRRRSPTPSWWRGFASMTPEKQRLIASMGGRKIHEMGRMPKYTSETARVSGKRCADKHPLTTERARELGRRGGLANRPEHLKNLWRFRRNCGGKGAS